MKFLSTPLAGAFVVIPDRIEDERGFFARSFCEREFAARNATVSWVQCNISFNAARGTLRGLHFAASPSHEAKLVRCTSGSIFDAIVDIRANSPTFGTWFAAELTQSNRHALYIPSGFAHGFQTLEDNTEVFYQMGDFFTPATNRGVRFDDPAVGIPWPLPCTCVSPKDLAHPLLADLAELPS
jgi:dTDP-4-dehydrorhamnose 3,5-epimerase